MDKNLENIVRRVANRNSITPDKGKLAVEIFFKNVKHLIQREDMPTIFMNGFGRFIADEGKIKRKLLTLKKRLIRGTITQETYDKEYKKLTTVLMNLNKNKHKREN